MSSIFLNILNMSLIASYVVIIVIIVRLMLKKAPKIFSYALWAIVLFRLLCPFTFESSLSFIPVNTEPISNNIAFSQNPTVDTGIEIADTVINKSVQTSLLAVNPTASVNPIQIVIAVGTIIWILGIVLLLTYGIISYYKLKLRTSTAILLYDNIYETDRIKTPFVLGLIKPRIYLPTNISSAEMKYIIKHEQTHIARYDYIIKPIAFLTLTLHWFNPLIWCSYFLMAKDMEMSCDETVIKNSSIDIRTNYSNSLLSLSVKQSGLLSPLAFGESNVKSRIKNVLNYKKPSFWIIILAVIIMLAVLVGLLFNPKSDAPDLSLLNINNALTAMATSGNVIVETEDNRTLAFSPHADFFEKFNQNNWKEKRVSSPFESIPTLKFIINDGYYINLYSYEDYAMVYFSDSKDKFQYYTIPAGAYESVEKYVLENGKRLNEGTRFTNKIEDVDKETGERVEENLIIILSSPLTSSNPSDYINAHGKEYETILKQGDDALNYLLQQFETGYNNDLRGHIMMQLCKDFLGVRNNVEDETLLPQEWYSKLVIYDEVELPNFVYDGDDMIEKLVYTTEVKQNTNPYRDGFVVVASKIHAYYEEENKLKVFVTTYYSNYVLYGKVLSEDGAGIVPTAITYIKNGDGNYILEKYEQAKDGSYFSKSIEDYCTMPISDKKISGLSDEIMKYYGNYEGLFLLMKENLIEHLKDNNQNGVNLKKYNGEIVPLT